MRFVTALVASLLVSTAAFAGECKTKSIADVKGYVHELGFQWIDVTAIKDPLLAKIGLKADPNETRIYAAIGQNAGVVIFADQDDCVTATAKGDPRMLASAIEAVAGIEG